MATASKAPAKRRVPKKNEPAKAKRPGFVFWATVIQVNILAWGTVLVQTGLLEVDFRWHL